MLVSLENFVRPELMFNDTYAHRASMSLTMRESFRLVASRLKDAFRPRKTLEIGSNDGVFIRNFEKDAAVAVEPCRNLADLTQEMGYATYPVFWTKAEAGKIVSAHGEMDLIYSANTICHIPDLVEVFEAVASALTPRGVFVFEDPSLLRVVANGAYDQFYDEHAHVFSVLALHNILNSCGLEIFEVESLNTHGGSNRIYAQKINGGQNQIASTVAENLERERESGLAAIGTYEIFSERVGKSKRDLVRLFTVLKEQRKKIVSYGATYKSATIFTYCRTDTAVLDYIVDSTPNKQGKFSPGMHIPIISPEEGFNETVDYAFLGAWNFAAEILKKEVRYINRGGKFITHVPEVHVI
jgi:methylation protein EvaC